MRDSRAAGPQHEPSAREGERGTGRADRPHRTENRVRPERRDSRPAARLTRRRNQLVRPSRLEF